jgi:hypothetical protein
MSGKPLPKAAAGPNGLPKDTPRRPNSNVFASLKATQILTLKPVLPAGLLLPSLRQVMTTTMLTKPRTHCHHSRLPPSVRFDNMCSRVQASARDGL